MSPALGRAISWEAGSWRAISGDEILGERDLAPTSPSWPEPVRSRPNWTPPLTDDIGGLPQGLERGEGGVAGGLDLEVRTRPQRPPANRSGGG